MEFFIPGRPKPKERARVGYSSKRRKFFSYTPQNTVLAEDNIRGFVIEKLRHNHFPFEIPIKMNVIFIFKPAKKTKLKKPPLPDGDNLLKTLWDALNGILYKDDTWVVEFHVAKRWAVDDEAEGIWFQLEPLSD